MFYSVLIDSEVVIKSITLIDQPDKNRIKTDIIFPYLKGEEFFVDGYLLNKSKISRIKIVSSEKSIDNLVDFKNEQRRMKNRMSNVVIAISYSRYDIMNDEKLVHDITTEILKEVKLNCKIQSQHRQNLSSITNVFLLFTVTTIN